jgi:hypothetical protein
MISEFSRPVKRNLPNFSRPWARRCSVNLSCSCCSSYAGGLLPCALAWGRQLCPSTYGSAAPCGAAILAPSLAATKLGLTNDGR